MQTKIKHHESRQTVEEDTMYLVPTCQVVCLEIVIKINLQQSKAKQSWGFKNKKRGEESGLASWSVD